MKEILLSAIDFFKRHWKLFVIKIPIILVILLTGYTAYIYILWNGDKAAAFEKMNRYKQLIDRTEDMKKGLPYTSADIDVSKKVVDIPTRIYDVNGEIIGEFFEQKRELVPYDYFPSDLVNAVKASEDRDFEKHSGVNPYGLIRAMLKNVLSLGVVQGGSTITQQLAKNFFTDMDRSLKRKIYEVFCAVEIESRYDKQDIMSMYLNLIYFGNGAYGAEAASKMFFDSSVKNLGTAECAMIVATISNPLYYSPLNNLDNSVKKTRRILTSLADAGFISEKKAEYLYNNFVRRWEIAFDANGKATSSLIGSFTYSFYRVNRAPYFNEYIRRIVSEKFGEETVKSGGLSIYTTIDAKKQDVALSALREAVAKQREYYRSIGENIRSSEKKAEHMQNADSIDGAFVSINPETGEIISYVGGYQFSSKSQLDHVSQMVRQPGSSFKPLVYCAAIEDKDITPSTIFVDEKKTFEKKYSPANYSGTYAGPVTVHQALVRSINTVAVSVLDKTGYSTVFDYIQKGLDLPSGEMNKRFMKTLSFALGTYEVSPLENATLHSMIVNGGKYVKPWGIKNVKDYNGNTIWNYEDEVTAEIAKKRADDRTIISPQAAAVTLNMLRYVLKKGGTAAATANAFRINFPAAGKTGTSTNWNDAWFVGYTADSVSAVWVGNTKGAISLGRGRSGGAVSAPVWGKYISSTYTDEKPGDFSVPEDGISRQTICLDSGNVPVDISFCPLVAPDELFISGTEPGEYCALHKEKTELSTKAVSEE